MLVVGAKGFAKEVLEILHKSGNTQNLVFFDDISLDLPKLFMENFPILRNEEQVKKHFDKHRTEFTLGLGNPQFRVKMFEKITALGGELVSVISSKAEIGSFKVNIGIGCNILPQAVIANETSIGKGCIIYYNTLVTHDCKVGDFVELSPGATLLGGCHIGDFSQIGSNATILPGIKIGKNVVIGAGAVVTKDVPDNSLAIGVPARITKNL